MTRKRKSMITEGEGVTMMMNMKMKDSQKINKMEKWHLPSTLGPVLIVITATQKIHFQGIDAFVVDSKNLVILL